MILTKALKAALLWVKTGKMISTLTNIVIEPNNTIIASNGFGLLRLVPTQDTDNKDNVHNGFMLPSATIKFISKVIDSLGRKQLFINEVNDLSVQIGTIDKSVMLQCLPLSNKNYPDLTKLQPGNAVATIRIDTRYLLALGKTATILGAKSIDLEISPPVTTYHNGKYLTMTGTGIYGKFSLILASIITSRSV